MKCRICGTKITPTTIKDGTHIKVTYNEKNYYFCCEKHCGEYMKELKKKEKFYKGRDEIDKYVKANIMLYKPEQILPTYFFDRLADLANGTTRSKEGKNNVIKNLKKEGYPLEVVLETFKTQKDTILYWFRNKNFNNERQKLNYMWRIIENHINDEYEKWQIIKQGKAVESIKTEIDQEQLKILYDYELNSPKNNKTTDMSEIFKEDDEEKEVKLLWET